MKIRIISAIVLALVAIPVTLYASDKIFTVVAVLVGIEAVREGLNLSKRAPILLALSLFLAMAFVGYFSYLYGFILLNHILILFIIMGVTMILVQNLEKFDFKDFSSLFGVMVYILVGFNVLITLKVHYNLQYFLYPALVAIVADSFGYFGGVTFGKHKLIEPISPNKTVEGAISATLFGIVFSYFFLSKLYDSTVIVLIISVVMVVLSQFGDLFASVIKRTYNVKDYARLIPGHGGILDRIDSMLYNYIVFSIILGFI